MAITTQQFDKEFGKRWGDTVDESMRNFADTVAVEIAKRAPFASGRLVKSIHAVRSSAGEGRHSYEVRADVPYARRRNYENNLHPQTKRYVQQGLAIAKSGGHKRWWKDVDA